MLFGNTKGVFMPTHMRVNKLKTTSNYNQEYHASSVLKLTC